MKRIVIWLVAMVAAVIQGVKSFLGRGTAAVGRGPRGYVARLEWALAQGYEFRGGVDTAFPTGGTETVQRWADEIWLELPEHVFWGPYLQEDVNSIIEVKQDLEAVPGEKITFTLARQLSGAGVQGDATLEGNEEGVSFYSDSVTINQDRNAVRLLGKMSERRTAFSQRMVAKQLLKDWLADLIDSRIFNFLSTSPTRQVFGGSASSTSTISVGDYTTLALLTQAKTVARKALPQIFPVNIEGSHYFLSILGPDALLDLKTKDPAWSQAQREAEIRGGKNPLFTGAEGIWDGVVIRSSTRVAITTLWGSASNLTGSSNIFVGRQAAVFAWGDKPSWVEQSFDYGNKTGFAIGAIWQVKKAVFNAADNGMIAIQTYRSNN